MRANLQKVTNAHISKVLKVGMRTIDRTKKKTCVQLNIWMLLVVDMMVGFDIKIRPLVL